MKIHPTPLRAPSGHFELTCQSTSNKFLVLNMNENFPAMHPSNALYFLHRVPYGLETIPMRYRGVRNPSGLQEKQISIKAREVSMVRK